MHDKDLSVHYIKLLIKLICALYIVQNRTVYEVADRTNSYTKKVADEIYWHTVQIDGKN